MWVLSQVFKMIDLIWLFYLYIFKVFLCAGHGHLYIEFIKFILIKKYLYNSVIVINK